MAMQIALSRESEELIRQQVDAGVYEDASELIEAALKLLYDPQRSAALKAAVEAGIKEAEDDEGVEFTPELMEEIRREVEQLVREGHIPNPEVCP